MIGSTLINYRITEKLGAGGQGTVYRAVDVKLDRPVVIKVLPPELTAKTVNFARFEREAKLASSLDHPNICTIYGLYEVDGTHFIAMQYVEGRNVRQIVGGRALKFDSALSIGVQVADALSAAHARGIIHRDIKAGNVMVTDAGLVKVLDFGLAKLIDRRDDAPDDPHLTEVGIPYGTATYAAPEQARGLKVDHRADVFSTGVLLYEMLAGIWPFQGKTSLDVRYAVIHDVPKLLAEVRREPVPQRLQEIVNRALAKEPSERYQKAGELRDDLKAVLQELGRDSANSPAVFDGVAPVAPRHRAGFGVPEKLRRFLRNLTGGAEPASTTVTKSPQQEIHTTPSPPAGDNSQTSIAILPFRNLSDDEATGFYEFSLADAVITELARVRSLVVRPSSVIAKYKGQQKDPREIGQELGVSAVLAASFLSAGGRLRVTAQLLDVSSGDILWSDSIDMAAEDVIAVQDTIARHIVDGLRIELSSDEQVDLHKQTTVNASAYEEYLRGRDRMGRYIYHTLEQEDVDEAIDHFKSAVELDANFALAHSALGSCYANRVIKSSGGVEDYARAENAFSTALALDPQLLEARLHMVFIHLWRGEKQKAREETEKLSQEAPNDVGVHFVRATLHRLDGEYDKALRSLERMLRLNPAERVVVSYTRARIFMYLGRYEDALFELDQGIAYEPDHPLPKTFRAVALFRRGNVREATELLHAVLNSHPHMDGIRPLLAMCLSAQGEHAAARRELTVRVKEAAAADHDVAYWLASAYAVEGKREDAFKWLDRAINLGNENRAWFESNPVWEPLRDDARFKGLMRQIEANRKKMTSDNN